MSMVAEDGGDFGVLV